MQKVTTVLFLTLLGGCGDSGEPEPVVEAPPTQADRVNEPVGVIDITGKSDAVGDVSYRFQGSVTAASGAPTVSCAYFPDGNESPNVPELVIQGGFAQEQSSVEIHLYDLLTTVGETEVQVDEGVPDLLVRARLSFDDPDSFVEYGLGLGASVSSYCEVELYERSLYVSGRVSCRDLFATLDSADFAIDSTAFASVSLDFNCPLNSLGQSGEFLATGGSGTGGSQAATGGSSPGTGGSVGTGGSASTGSCSGSVTPCSLLGTSSCSATEGCTWEEECEGVVSSCYYQFYSFECYAQDGCVWSSYSDSCSGSARSCSLYSGSSSCTGQSGCRWSTDCTGAAKSCSSYLSSGSCSAQPGCSWTD